LCRSQQQQQAISIDDEEISSETGHDHGEQVILIAGGGYDGENGSGEGYDGDFDGENGSGEGYGEDFGGENVHGES